MIDKLTNKQQVLLLGIPFSIIVYLWCLALCFNNFTLAKCAFNEYNEIVKESWRELE